MSVINCLFVKMTFNIPKWKTKITNYTKNKNRKKFKAYRKLKLPTRKELNDEEGAKHYCSKMRLSQTATHRVIDIVTGKCADIDFRDHRTIPKNERVPRSLECCETPPRYWDISI